MSAYNEHAELFYVIHGLQSVANVFPVAAYLNARLDRSPRQKVVGATVKDGIAWRRGRRARRHILVQLVTIVAYADFKLDRLVYLRDHCGVKECGMQLILFPMQEWLDAKHFGVFYVADGLQRQLAENSLYLEQDATSVSNAFALLVFFL